MPTECSLPAMQFARRGRRAVVAGFAGSVSTWDPVALLLSVTDPAIQPADRFAACFSDEHEVDHVATLQGQRAFATPLSDEELIGHDALRHGPVLGVGHNPMLRGAS